MKEYEVTISKKLLETLVEKLKKTSADLRSVMKEFEEVSKELEDQLPDFGRWGYRDDYFTPLYTGESPGAILFLALYESKMHSWLPHHVMIDSNGDLTVESEKYTSEKIAQYDLEVAEAERKRAAEETQ